MKSTSLRVPARLLLLIVLFVAGSFFISAAKRTVNGIVFDDANNNGKYDKGETGIAGAAISNQLDVVMTDKNGQFKIPVPGYCIIFVSKPSGYRYHTDQDNIPRFYYIHHPKGSPSGLKYEGIAPTGKLPKKLFFSSA